MSRMKMPIDLRMPIGWNKTAKPNALNLFVRRSKSLNCRVFQRRWCAIRATTLNAMGPAGFAALLTSTSLRQLGILCLRNNPVGDAGMSKFATAALVKGLTTLDLGFLQIGDKSIQTLADAPLEKLVRLTLCYNAIGDAGAIALARSTHLHGLAFLDLSNN